MKKLFLSLLMALPSALFAAPTPVDYVSTLVGTLSKHSLSTGNTYPAIALPWGMNFWTPQTGRMGDGWHKLTFKVTQRQMSAMLGVNRVTVNTALQNLYDKGLVRKDSGYYHVLDAKGMLA